jgi:hypothetical protein
VLILGQPAAASAVVVVVATAAVLPSQPCSL